MLFNSVHFLFIFLPISVIGYYAILKYFGKLPSQLWLFAASLGFYAYWNPDPNDKSITLFYVSLIIVSMIFNYLVGQKLLKSPTKPLLIFGLAANLSALAYFKYMGFFVENMNSLTGTSFTVPKILLPLGISFFTFQKIAFLVDCYKNRVPKEQNWINFGLFISFFPQLIAGPIVHHKEMMPQFEQPKRFNWENIAIGVSLLVIGLFKKVIIADALDGMASPLFKAAETQQLHIVQAWAAMLAYTFQIYFDFSGYSDMALGIGKMFGVRLPVNFFSPYKSKNIIEFWRRWHMTLSRFLRDYLYISLGGNRKGFTRRYINLMITMVLGGFWHGAQWTFFIWGGMHGTYLIINHAWNALPKLKTSLPLWFTENAARLTTFTAVALAWVFFRAKDAKTAFGIITSLTHTADMSSLKINQAFFSSRSPLRSVMDADTATMGTIAIIASFLICWLMPNSIEIMRLGKPAISGIRGFVFQKSRFASTIAWRPSLRWGVVTGIAMSICIVKVFYEPSQVFLYFQF